MALKLPRKNVIALFNELGFDEKATTGWTNARMTAKVQNLADTIDGDEDLKEKAGEMGVDSTKLLKQITKAAESEEDITVIGSEPEGKASSNGKAPKEKAQKKEKEEVERNAWGAKVDTLIGKVVDFCIEMDQPMHEADIRKALDYKTTIEYMLDKYVRLGYLGWTEENGYFNKEKAKESKTTSKAKAVAKK